MTVLLLFAWWWEYLKGWREYFWRKNRHMHKYRKVASSKLSRLVAHLRIFRVFMKGKFDAYVQRVPALRAFWNLQKTVLHEICVSGTVGVPY